MKVTEKMVEKLTNMGANEWHKTGYNRLYLNEAAEQLVGLETRCYKTGNIAEAWLKGERISNSEARRISRRIGNPYIDLDTMELITNCEELERAIAEKEAELTASEVASEESAVEDTAAAEAESKVTEPVFIKEESKEFPYCYNWHCSNGKFIKALGFRTREHYEVDGVKFGSLIHAKNYCLGLPLNHGRKKIDKSVFEGPKTAVGK